MTFRELYYSRRSTRSFTERGLDREEIRSLLDAAIHAPNACNAQSWRFWVVTDPEVKAKFASEQICAPWVASAPVIFVLGADSTWLRNRFGERAEQFVLQDTALAAENMLLAAAEMKLGGCIIGAFHEEKCRALLDIPENIGIHMLLPIGEASSEVPDRGRKPMDDFVTYVGDDYSVPREYHRIPFVMRGTSLPGAVFEELNLIGATYEDVNLAESKFNNINMHAVKFTDINMSAASFGGLRLDESSFGCVGMQKAEFTNVDFTGAKFTNCKFNNTDFTECDVTGMKVDRVDMVNAVRFPRRWSAGFYPKSTFFDVNLRESTFEDVTLDEAKFIGVSMKNASFRNTELTECDLSGMTVDGISVEDAIAFYKENKK
ncbi:MAG: hypothetical protein E7662_00465 [Ruminococcaceae bacterium]|nr:hypothetical protein [Oscillospiraceae bacterium]